MDSTLLFLIVWWISWFGVLVIYELIQAKIVGRETLLGLFEPKKRNKYLEEKET